MSIPFRRYLFHCRWTTDARLPDYSGSTLRGALGWALRKASCMLRSRQCPGCILQKNCAYATLFATEIYAESSGHPVNARPHPMIVQPDVGASGDAPAGQEWNFSLALFGPGVAFLSYVVLSVRLMGEAGIGSGAKRGLGRFVLERVSCDDQVVYDASRGDGLLTDSVPETLMLRETAGPPVALLRLNFLTPLRLKQHNTLSRELPFHLIIRAALRRVAALETAYGQGAPKLDYSGLVRSAEMITTRESTLYWKGLERYSNRQEQKISLSGLCGTLTCAGALTEFMPLLDYTARVHLGKQTLFGLGRFTAEALPAAGES